ncbi:hypothetical protein L211DRAFT_325628 [Terfezia boudieri ATCC MYA-4762]|uniref:CBM1 domain-containing protein n=1 Tax=Terfezia boudieri ATCC MYA-4762 TaxID=1051890 RepID=A0A3N4LHY0_9PEZI|nr:hypothetical protein L211DRAFT_325628 [Terfezia boudieri ATCC MYA-4762]
MRLTLVFTVPSMVLAIAITNPYPLDLYIRANSKSIPTATTLTCLNSPTPDGNPPTLPPPSQPYGQCGGITYRGPITCPECFVCVKLSPELSRCLPE